MAQKKSEAEDQETRVEPSPPPAPAEVQRRTLAEWAEEAGYPPGTPGYWKFSAAGAFKGWSEGALVTREEVESAMSEQAKQVTR